MDFNKKLIYFVDTICSGCVYDTGCSINGYQTMNYYYENLCHPQVMNNFDNNIPGGKLVEIRQPIEHYIPVNVVPTIVSPIDTPIKKFGKKCGKCRQGCKQNYIP